MGSESGPVACEAQFRCNASSPEVAPDQLENRFACMASLVAQHVFETIHGQCRKEKICYLNINPDVLALHTYVQVPSGRKQPDPLFSYFIPAICSNPDPQPANT